MEINADFPQLLECLFQPKRYKVLWGGRGAGRSWGVARALLLLGTQKAIRVLCVRELQNSISESVHKLLSDQIEAMGLSNFYEIQVARIIGKNGTSFAFDGIKNNTNKIKSYEGIDYCWVEEANKVSRASWGTLIPTIRKETSEIWLTFNPELDTDYTYTRFVKNSDLQRVNGNVSESHDSIVVKMTWKDNPWFPEVLKTEMEGDRKRDYDYFLNVWEGHTIQMLEGAVYAKELRRAQEEGRICNVPWQRDVPVDTFWDLGRGDNTSIWFAQRVAMQTRVLAYYENNSEDITHFLKKLQEYGYVYGTHFLPHDAKHKKLVYKHSIEQIVKAKYPDTTVLPKTSKLDGINAARMLLPSCWFDEDECADGLDSLRHYRYKVIDGQLSNEPMHDWASDGADAFRYMAMAMLRERSRGSSAGIAARLATKSKAVVQQIGTASLGWMG